MTLMTARPTAIETGLPPKVANVSPGNLSATSAVAIVQPIGTPLPIPFAEVMMSGVDAPVLDAEPLVAGAAPAGLHLVRDAQAAVIAW